MRKNNEVTVSLHASNGTMYMLPGKIIAAFNEETNKYEFVVALKTHEKYEKLLAEKWDIDHPKVAILIKQND